MSKQREPVNEVSKAAFGNPYAKEEGVTVRTSLNVPERDYRLVQQISPGCGTMTAISGTLWKALCDELRTRQIVSFEHVEEFRDFVANVALVDKRELEQMKMDSIRKPLKKGQK